MEALKDWIQKVMPEDVAEVDPWVWAHNGGLLLDGRGIMQAGHEYQSAIMQEKFPRQCRKKAAQIGLTSIEMIRVMHGMIHNRYPTGVLYLFPSDRDVTDFSRGRFNPLIDDNPELIGQYIRDTDAASIKRINRATLYLRGAREARKIHGIKATSSRLKSIPVDAIIFDEFDEMGEEMVDLAVHRLAHSEVKDLVRLGTPTLPDYGIDAEYQKSDQRVWMIRCGSCNKFTCLELEFPDCLERQVDGTVKRICTKCKAEIYPRDGVWVAQVPSKSNEYIGWWISQLNSAYVDPKDILDAWEDPPRGDRTEIANSMLGMAHVMAENRLSPSDLWACCSSDGMLSSHPGPTAMGVDVGNVLNVVIAEKPDEKRIRAVYAAAVKDFNDLHDLMKRYNVEVGVIDLKPEIRKVREFQEAERDNCQVWLCDYQEHAGGHWVWNDQKGMIVGNRTEICDATHHLVMNGFLILPRRNPTVEQFIKQMCNIAKVLEEDEATGSKIYRYRKLGDDHYRHAMNYLLLAMERLPVVYLPDDYRPDTADTKYDPFA